MNMSEKEIQTLVSVIAAQRNAALDAVAQLEARLAMLTEENAALQNRIDSLTAGRAEQ